MVSNGALMLYDCGYTIKHELIDLLLFFLIQWSLPNYKLKIQKLVVR